MGGAGVVIHQTIHLGGHHDRQYRVRISDASLRAEPLRLHGHHEKSLVDVGKAILPFILLFIGCLLVLTYVPQISTLLPGFS